MPNPVLNSRHTSLWHWRCSKSNCKNHHTGKQSGSYKPMAKWKARKHGLRHVTVFHPGEDVEITYIKFEEET